MNTLQKNLYPTTFPLYTAKDPKSNSLHYNVIGNTPSPQPSPLKKEKGAKLQDNIIFHYGIVHLHFTTLERYSAISNHFDSY